MRGAEEGRIGEDKAVAGGEVRDEGTGLHAEDCGVCAAAVQAEDPGERERVVSFG